MFDDACLLWSETCDGRGACLEYDTERLPVVFFGVSLAIKCLSYMCIVGTFFAALRASRRSQEHVISTEDGGGGDGANRSNGIVAGLSNEAFDPEHTITEDGGGGDGGGGGDHINGVVRGYNSASFRTDHNGGSGGVDGGGDGGVNRSNGVVRGHSNAAFLPDDPGTPQSDITVSTILSSYSMATESTQL